MLPAPKRVETNTIYTKKDHPQHEASPRKYRYLITRTHMKAPFTLRYTLRARRANTRENAPTLDSGVS
jgi:tRNA U38,U39,U40 pseudouridine synthase TruA